MAFAAARRHAETHSRAEALRCRTHQRLAARTPRIKDILSIAGHCGESHSAHLPANPKVKAEYDALAPEFEIAAELFRARMRAGLSQAELAARMRTSQSTIARLESGQTLPSTKTLLRYAEATGSKFHVRLSAA